MTIYPSNGKTVPYVATNLGEMKDTIKANRIGKHAHQINSNEDKKTRRKTAPRNGFLVTMLLISH